MVGQTPPLPIFSIVDPRQEQLSKHQEQPSLSPNFGLYQWDFECIGSTVYDLVDVNVGYRFVPMNYYRTGR